MILFLVYLLYIINIKLYKKYLKIKLYNKNVLISKLY